ncbi:MAG: hypothetical protein HYZ28_10965 [Myxococcales bacterium]|nr:hypothetical protein [Myxococcales bacterium]
MEAKRSWLGVSVAAGLFAGGLSGLLFSYWWFGEDGLTSFMGLTHVLAGAVLGLIPGLGFGLRR